MIGSRRSVLDDYNFFSSSLINTVNINRITAEAANTTSKEYNVFNITFCRSISIRPQIPKIEIRVKIRMSPMRMYEMDFLIVPIVLAL
jgi:hypothetical protein